MKKIIILIISLIFIISFYSCSTAYSGIAYSEQENVYYITELSGKLYKCKLINKKLHCIEVKLENLE
jgi:uncharacterized protein YxeA